MKHYILTRFNKGYVRLPNPYEWLEYRMKIFEKYTLPSIKRQTNQNFKWLLLFDRRTPDKYLKYKGIVFDAFKNYIDKNEWTITTRLDSDDILMPDAVEKIQNAFEEKNIIIGAKNNIYVEGDGYYKDKFKPHKSSFISLIEPPGEKKTVYDIPHPKMRSKYNYKNLDGIIGTHVEHGKNKGNHKRNKR